jgi:hypothetical protein
MQGNELDGSTAHVFGRGRGGALSAGGHYATGGRGCDQVDAPIDSFASQCCSPEVSSQTREYVRTRMPLPDQAQALSLPDGAHRSRKFLRPEREAKYLQSGEPDNPALCRGPAVSSPGPREREDHNDEEYKPIFFLEEMDQLERVLPPLVCMLVSSPCPT